MAENPNQTITRLRKSGKLRDAWELGVQAVKEHPSDQYIKGAMFWVCYAYIKNLQEKIKERENSNNGESTPSFTEIKEIEFYVRCIAKLDVTPDDFNYRSLLLINQRSLEHFPNLVLLLFTQSKNKSFSSPFGKLFLTEDFIPYNNSKGESPSLTLKFVRKVASAWLNSELVRQIKIEEVCDLIERARRQVKDRQHLIWLDYDQAKCLIFAKRFEEAKRAARKIVQKKQKEAWALSLLAQTYEKDDVDAAICLYSQALCCVQEETFALPALKDFAPVLARKGYFDQASMCVKRALKCYQDNEWKVRSDLESLLNQSWYNPQVEIASLQSFISNHAEQAIDYIAGEREKLPAIVSNLHKSGKGFHAYINKNESVSVRLGLYKSKGLPSVGDYVSVTLSVEDRTVFEASLSQPSELPGVKVINGTLDMAPKGFGFVGDVFVPPHLITSEMDGCPLEVLAILSLDKKKNRHGLKAISVKISTVHIE